MNGTITGLQLVDLSVATSLHNVVLRGTSDGQPCALDFHLSSRPGHCGLLEIRVRHLRLFYLQRVTMMLVNYFRDHIANSINCLGMYAAKGTPPLYEQYAAAPPPLSCNAAGMCASPATAVDNRSGGGGGRGGAGAAANSGVGNRGIFRVVFVAEESEVHLPAHSKGSDAMVILPRKIIVHKGEIIAGFVSFLLPFNLASYRGCNSCNS